MILNIKDRNIVNTFLRVLLVQLFSVILPLSGAIVDTIVIAKYYGPVGMASAGLATPISTMYIMFGYMLSSGAQNLCGGFMGRGEKKKVNQVANLAVFLAVAIGTVCAVLTLVFAENIAIFLGSNEETYQGLVDYIKGLSFTSIPSILITVLIGILQIDGDGFLVLCSSVFLVVSAFVFDILNATVFHGGLFGMGLGTTISYFLTAIILLTHFLKKNKSISLSFRHFTFENLTKILVLGFPQAVYFLCSGTYTFFVNNLSMSIAGTIGVFAFTTMVCVVGFSITIASGFGSSTLIVSSVLVGEENRRSIHHTLKYILMIGVSFSVVFVIVFFFGKEIGLSSVFCSEDGQECQGIIKSMFRCVAFSVPFTITNTIFMYYYQSMKRVKLSALYGILDSFVFVLIYAFVLSRFFGMNGIFLSPIAAEITTLFVMILVASIKQKKLVTSVHDIMMMPNDFGIEKENRLNISITKRGEISKISQEIIDFLNKKNIDEKKSKALGLCMEELAGVSFENAKKTRKPTVDIYVTCKNGDLKLRIRDNCLPYKPEILSPDGDNINMKIVQGLAKDVNYSVVLGMNVFAVSI